MVKIIDLNCDMGESFGAYRLGMDEEMLPFISSANVACGFHAGDPLVMRRTVRLAKEHGIAIGAHPGFPDLLGFGRRKMDCSYEEISDYLTYQIGALQAFCQAEGTSLHHVKPHGALYNMAATDPKLTQVIAEAIHRTNPQLLLVILAGPRAEEMSKVAQDAGVRTIFEAFPDRAYTENGELLSRKLPGAVIHNPEEVATRALRMAEEGQVVTTCGKVIPLKVHSLCVHGDTPNSVALAAAIRQRLEDKIITVRAEALS